MFHLFWYIGSNKSSSKLRTCKFQVQMCWICKCFNKDLHLSCLDSPKFLNLLWLWKCYTIAITRFPGEIARPRHEAYVSGSCKDIFSLFVNNNMKYRQKKKDGSFLYILQMSFSYEECLKGLVLQRGYLHTKSNSGQNCPCTI